MLVTHLYEGPQPMGTQCYELPPPLPQQPYDFLPPPGHLSLGLFPGWGGWGGGAVLLGCQRGGTQPPPPNSPPRSRALYMRVCEREHESEHACAPPH